MRDAAIGLVVSLAVSFGVLAAGEGGAHAQAATLSLSAASAKATLRKEDQAACQQLAVDKGISKRDSAGYVAICMGDRQAVRKAAAKNKK
ncbi:MAG: hypothetical protein ACR2K5_02190 [Pseudolabrys sp.]